MVPVTVLLKLTGDVDERLQTVCVAGNTFIDGVGDTLTVNKRTAPIQVAAVGVTVNTPVVVAAPVLAATKEPTDEPAPDAPMPMVVLLFVHVYVVPVTVLLKLIIDVLAVLQTVCVAGNTFIDGVGDTLTVNDCTGPTQVADVGVTAITAVVVVLPVLVAVNAAMLPEPDAHNPSDGLELVQA